MEYRSLGETGMRVSEISLGTWALGGEWGTVSDAEAYATLNRAVDLGVNFLDTADVYGDGRSEKLIGRLLRERQGEEICWLLERSPVIVPIPGTSKIEHLEQFWH